MASRLSAMAGLCSRIQLAQVDGPVVECHVFVPDFRAHRERPAARHVRIVTALQFQVVQSLS